MCRYDTRSFDPQVIETRAARRWIVAVLQRWQLESLVDELELAASELATNALLHTRSGFSVTLAASDRFVELAVRDNDPREPVIRPARLDLLADVEQLASAPPLIAPSSTEIGPTGNPAPQSPTGAAAHDLGSAERHPSLHVGPAGSIAAGRGLLIVDAIADEWGVASHANGKDVWMRVPIPAQWPYLDHCNCADVPARTPSGRPVQHDAGEWDQRSDPESDAHSDTLLDID